MSHIIMKPRKSVSYTNNMENILNSFFHNTALNQNYLSFPVYQVEEQDSEYKIILELPGYDQNMIEVKAEQDTLEVSHTRQKDEESPPRIREFKRKFTIPQDVEQEKISARFKNGLLSIELPKKEAAKPQKIQINS